MNKLAEKIKKNKEELAKEKFFKNIMADVAVYETNVKKAIDVYPSIISLIVSDVPHADTSIKEIDKVSKRIKDFAKSPYILLAEKFSPYEVFKFANDAIIKIQKLENKFDVIFNEENLSYDFLILSHKGYIESLNKARELDEKIEYPKYQKSILQITDFHNKALEKHNILKPQITESKSIVSLTNETAKKMVGLDIATNRKK